MVEKFRNFKETRRHSREAVSCGKAAFIRKARPAVGQ
jgi:hypothetical protein